MPLLPMPVNLSTRGMSGRRTKISTRAAPASSAVAALSMAEAPAPTTVTRLAAGRRAVEGAGVFDAKEFERGQRGEAAEATADDGDIEHAATIGLARRQPGVGGQVEPAKVLPQPRFQFVERGWRPARHLSRSPAGPKT